MSSRERRRLAVVALVLALGVCIFLLVRLVRPKGLQWAADLAGIGAFFLALIAVLAPLVSRWWRYPQASSTSLMSVEDAADRLAKDLGSQWVDNERQWKINDPYAMPVRWEVVRTRGVTMAGSNPREGDDKPDELSADLSGRFDDISRAFNQSKSHRLIIVGPPGAGKSVLATQLAIQLAEREARPPGAPVPVILQAARWNPDESITINESLSDWIASQLTLKHEWLAAKPRTVESASFAKALIPKYVIPILDGLDELPEHQRPRAIEAINAYGSDRELVVTSRGKEYAAAVAAAGRAISRAVEVQVLPLGVKDVKEYLTDATEVPADRWKPVFDLLKEDRGRQLAAVLTTPLMLWLSRAIYGKGGSNPRELVSAELFNDKEAIENHLIKGLIPAVYDQKTGLSRFGCSPRKAQRWLAFLAAYLDQMHAPDLEWWHLTGAVRSWRPVGFAIRGALLFGAAWGLAIWVTRQHRYQVHGVDARSLLAGQPLGRRLLPSVTRIQGLVLEPAQHGLRSATDTIIGFFPWHSLQLLEFWVILGALCAGIVYTFSSDPPPRALTIRLARVVIAVIRLFVVAVVLAGLTIFAVWALSFVGTPHMATQALSSLLLLIILWVLADFVGDFTEELDVPRSMNALEALRLDRRSYLLAAAVKRTIRAALLWLFLGPTVMLAYVIYGTISLLCRIMLGSGLTASGLFSDARLWLASTRRMPLRMMAFLDDAVTVGILRQTGTAFQFRHILLQRHLSIQYPRWSRRIVALAVRRAGRPIRFLEEWSFNWWWWSSASIKPWSEPIWELRFEEAAYALPDRVGRPIEGIHREGPGVAQPFAGVGSSPAWVICAVPRGHPIAVAKPVWEALRQATGGTDGDAFAALGFPSRGQVVPPDANRVHLREGSWGPGLLLRDPEDDSWHWQPEPRFHFVPMKKWPWAEPPPPQLRARVEATIPCTRSDLVITPQMHQELATMLPAGDLARFVTKLSSRAGGQLHAERWQDGQVAPSHDEGSCACVVGRTDGKPALVAEVMWSLKKSTDVITCKTASITLTAVVELRIEDIRAWRDAVCGTSAHRVDEGHLRLSLEDLLGVFAAAWYTANQVAKVIVGDTSAMPPAGPPLVDLLLSAATPLDLLLGARTVQEVNLSDRTTLISLLLSGRHGRRLKRGDLRDFVDFSPLGLTGRKSWPGEMSVRIASPLQLSSDNRQQLTREAVAFMLPFRFSETSDVEWSDAIRAALHRTYSE